MCCGSQKAGDELIRLKSGLFFNTSRFNIPIHSPNKATHKKLQRYGVPLALARRSDTVFEQVDNRSVNQSVT